MGNIFDRAPTSSFDEFSDSKDDQPSSPEQIEKGRQIAEYYDNLPSDAEPSPVEPLFKDIFSEKIITKNKLSETSEFDIR